MPEPPYPAKEGIGGASCDAGEGADHSDQPEDLQLTFSPNFCCTKNLSTSMQIGAMQSPAKMSNPLTLQHAQR